MTIAVVSVKNQVKKHEKIAKSQATVDLSIHEAACEDLLHCATHGDTSLCFDLFTRLEKTGVRVASLKGWFMDMSGNQMTAEKGVWKMKRGWTREKFTLDLAESTPFWTREQPKEPKDLSLLQILKSFAGYVKKIDRQAEDGHFIGDPEAAKAIINNVVNLAEEQAKRLTAQQLGKSVDASVANVLPADSNGANRTQVIEAKQGRLIADNEGVQHEESEVVAA